MIEARGLEVRQGHHAILRNICFCVARGELVGLIGPPESGKSMLLKVLCGLRLPQRGQVLWDGAPVQLAHLQSFQSSVGFAFQNNALFDADTVFDNVAFPLRQRRLPAATIAAKVEARLRAVELWEARHKYPQMLSGGMQKRLGVARATVTNPQLGLFDEPTSGLDPQTSGRILALLTGLAQADNMAALVVSNDLASLFPFCRRVLMLNEGALIYDGPVDRLAQSGRPEVVQFAAGSDVGPL